MRSSFEFLLNCIDWLCAIRFNNCESWKRLGIVSSVICCNVHYWMAVVQSTVPLALQILNNLLVESMGKEAAIKRFGPNDAFEHDQQSGVSGNVPFSSRSTRDILRRNSKFYFARRNGLRWTIICCNCNYYYYVLLYGLKLISLHSFYRGTRNTDHPRSPTLFYLRRLLSNGFHKLIVQLVREARLIVCWIGRSLSATLPNVVAMKTPIKLVFW